MKLLPVRSFAFLLALLAVADCSSTTGLDTQSTGVSKFDGTYDFFFKYPSPSGQTSRTLARYLFISNGVVSSSDRLASGSVDSFGKITFHTPCPINSSTATWTGSMNASALSGSNFGQETYTCSIAIGGGSLDSWQANQAP